MYDQAINCDISPLSFWNMSIDEIVDVINAYMEKEKHRLKTQIIMMEIQAQQIAERILPSDNHEVTHLWDFYPGLFEAERKLIEEQTEADDLEKLKSRRKRFATAYNSRVGGDN